jgi:hypothetical protein
MKRKYTYEQLKFYFEKLQSDLKRIPREEDMNRAKKMPSVTAYSDRLGSWNKAVELFGNRKLSERQCKFCKKILHAKAKNHRFCSKDCERKYLARKYGIITPKTREAIIKELGGKCAVCGFTEVIEIHELGERSESSTRINRAFKNGKLDTLTLLCANHHILSHRKKR